MIIQSPMQKVSLFSLRLRGEGHVLNMTRAQSVAKKEGKGAFLPLEISSRE
jgi:hypothetical protein